MQTISADNLWVVCDHAPYCSLSVDLEKIYLAEQDAIEEANKMSALTSTFGLHNSTKYFVLSLDRAIDIMKQDASDEGALNERERHYG